MTVTWSFVLLVGLGILASWLDISQRRLPNWLSALVLLSGFAVTLASGGLPLLISHAAHFAIALSVGIGIYALGLFGAGDTKFYGAIAGWFPFQDGIRLLVSVSMVGVLVLMVWALTRRSRGQKVFAQGRQPHNGVPYGVAIAGGAILLEVTQFLAS